MSFTAELFFKFYTLKQNAVIIYSAVLVNDTELLIGAAAAELLLHSRPNPYQYTIPICGQGQRSPLAGGTGTATTGLSGVQMGLLHFQHMFHVTSAVYTPQQANFP